MKYICVLLLQLVLSISTLAGPGDTPLNCSPDGVGVGGYDLVSYHQADGPVPGAEQHAVREGGLNYRFASAENLELFRRDPEQYLPVYRGWCAATLAMGRFACPDYTNFKIENGRLLLFEVTGFTNGKTLWNSDPGGFRERADKNFSRLLK